MAGMGAAITKRDMKLVVRRPKRLFIGILSQFIFMPMVALSCAMLLYPDPKDDGIKLAILVIGCCPGGTTSNIQTYWANGNVALSLCMTALNTTIAIGMQPLLLYLFTTVLDL